MTRKYGLDNPDDEGADYEYVIRTLQNIRRGITQQFHKRANSAMLEDAELGVLIHFYNLLYEQEAKWRYLADYPLIGARPKWVIRNESLARQVSESFTRTMHRRPADATT